jgi:hypothetical protein
MKVRIPAFTVTIDPAAWAENFSLEASEVRDDVRNYFTAWAEETSELYIGEIGCAMLGLHSARAEFHCDPCECGGSPECDKCNGNDPKAELKARTQ